MDNVLTFNVGIALLNEPSCSKYLIGMKHVLCYTIKIMSTPCQFSIFVLMIQYLKRSLNTFNIFST